MGVEPVQLFDTQIACALLGRGHSVGYANLVARELGAELPKDATRSNWLARPLSAAQLRYAALDVEWLHRLAVKFVAELTEVDRLSWAFEEYKRLLSAHEASRSNPAARIKGRGRLSPRAQALSDRLAQWRDARARADDLPRSRLLGDALLLELAAKPPGHLGALAEFSELPRRTLRTYGRELLEVLQTPLTELPDTPGPRPAAPDADLVKRLKTHLVQVAEQWRLAPELIARRTDLETMARAFERGARGRQLLPADFTGWRDAVVAEALEAIE